MIFFGGSVFAIFCIKLEAEGILISTAKQIQAILSDVSSNTLNCTRDAKTHAAPQILHIQFLNIL